MSATVSALFAWPQSVPSTIASRCAAQPGSLRRVSLMDSDNPPASLRASRQVAP
jgi:hypothetical protein